MTMKLKNKRDRATVEELTPADKMAILQVAAGAGDEDVTEAVGLFMDYARREGWWLACDCAGDDDASMPLVAPCRRGDTVYWRTLPHSAERHAQDCVFHDTAHNTRPVLANLQREARVAPTGNFEILR